MTHPHWEYFLAIEDDLVRCARFVEFAQTNFKTHSLEFARLLLASASEFNVVAKLICQHHDPKSKAGNIDGFRKEIRVTYPKFATIEIAVPRYGLSFQPWESWRADKNPNWWSSYNDVKHRRDEHSQEATLENALNAVAGLMCGLLYFYELKGGRIMLSPKPQILDLKYHGSGQLTEHPWQGTLPH